MSAPLLECGRDPSTVWDDAGAGELDEHETTCPFCLAVVAQRDALADASNAYVRRAVEAPAGLAESVMHRVSAELRPGRLVPVPGPGTRVLVSEAAIGNAVRAVLDGDPAVIARRCRVEEHDPVEGVRIWLTVAVSFEHYSRHGEEVVRARVIAAMRELFELPVSRVDIDVVDVFTERPVVHR